MTRRWWPGWSISDNCSMAFLEDLRLDCTTTLQASIRERLVATGRHRSRSGPSFTPSPGRSVEGSSQTPRADGSKYSVLGRRGAPASRRRRGRRGPAPASLSRWRRRAPTSRRRRGRRAPARLSRWRRAPATVCGRIILVPLQLGFRAPWGRALVLD